MINTIIILMVSALAIQPATQTDTRHDTVEIVPSSTYVICTGNCTQPTPKVKKVVLKRLALPQDKQQTPVYTKITEFLKEQQEKTSGKAEGPVAVQRTPAAGRSKAFAAVTAEKTTETIHFDLNSSVIREEEKAKLRAWLDRVNADRFEVDGYTCRLGGEQPNLKVAAERAEAVKKYILEKRRQGVVTARGLGKKNYVSRTDLPPNRRVEIRALVNSPAEKSKTVAPKDEAANAAVTVAACGAPDGVAGSGCHANNQ